LLYSTPAGEEIGTEACLIFNFSYQVQTHMPGLVEEMEEAVGYYHLLQHRFFDPEGEASPLLESSVIL
jgi:hypothetical protein